MVRLLKAHGSENTFFVIDEEQFSRPLTEQQWQKLAQRLCDEEKGILGGADGILAVLQADSSSSNACGRMRIFNQDGSEASMCGNGLRIVTRYLSEKTGKESFTIQTQQADLSVKQAQALSDQLSAYQVMISPVSFAADKIGMKISGKYRLLEERLDFLSSELKFSAVSVPNPHLIAFIETEEFPKKELQRVAELLNNENVWFPEGVNVSFVKVLGDQQLFVQTYERGVGFTNACGTAMSASSLIYVLCHGGNFEELIDVRNPGGLVRTIVHESNGDYWMELIGNATYTHHLEIAEAALLDGDFEQMKSNATDEQKIYQEFIEMLSTEIF